MGYPSMVFNEIKTGLLDSAQCDNCRYVDAKKNSMMFWSYAKQQRTRMKDMHTPLVCSEI
jgi:hypothetical protein